MSCDERQRRQSDRRWPYFNGQRQRIRDVRTGPDGYLYVLTDDPVGNYLKLAHAIS